MGFEAGTETIKATFQFQTGSIKSRRFRLHLLIMLSFNSKLVRLKVPAGTNPQPWKTGFNSKLVRLKVVFGCSPAKTCDRLFQFQTGSIKSVNVTEKIIPFDPVSIPNWFD